MPQVLSHSPTNHRPQIAVALLLLGLSIAAPASADSPGAVLDRVRLTQRLGQTVPLDVPFTDDAGRAVTLRHYCHDRPIVLVPLIYRCPMLCTQVLNMLQRTADRIDLLPGRDFEIVVFSFDPRETVSLAADKKLQTLSHIIHPERRNGWHFLTGPQASIDAVTGGLGYHFVYDQATQQFAHPAAYAVLTGRAAVSRYLIGLDYQPKDLRLAILEASQGRVGSFVDRVILRCYCYDPRTGRYGLAVMNTMRAGGAVTLTALFAMVCVLHRRRNRLETAPRPSQEVAS